MSRDVVEVAVAGRTVERGVVLEVEDGRGVVRVGDGGTVVCDILKGAAGPDGVLRSGERVLVLLPCDGETRGCILGSLEESRPTDGRPASEIPRRIAGSTIVLEADTELELRVGDNRIVITRDGRILIQGRNIVSRAKEQNRVRGSSVTIN